MMEPELNTQQVASILDVHIVNVRRAIKEKRLHARKDSSGLWHIPITAVENYKPKKKLPIPNISSKRAFVSSKETGLNENQLKYLRKKRRLDLVRYKECLGTTKRYWNSYTKKISQRLDTKLERLQNRYNDLSTIEDAARILGYPPLLLSLDERFKTYKVGNSRFYRESSLQKYFQRVFEDYMENSGYTDNDVTRMFTAYFLSVMPWITEADAARLLGVGRGSIGYLVEKGEVSHRKVGPRRLISLDSINF